MEGAGALQVTAEISLGLAGFSGIVLALTKDPKGWDPMDSVRILSLLSVSLATMALSLLPFGLHFAGLTPPTLWRVSSLAMVLGITPIVVVVLRQMANLEIVKGFGGIQRTPLAVAVIVPGVLNLVAQACNALSIGFSGSLAVFYFGLWWLVVYSGLQFAWILFIRPS